MKIVRMKNTYNHTHGVLDETGRMHAWCDDADSAVEDWLRCLDVFPTSEIVELVECENAPNDFPDVCGVYVVEPPMITVLEFQKTLLECWVLSPSAVIEVDQKRAKALEKPIMDSYESQIALLGSFTDIRFCYSHCGNRVTFTFLAGVYGRIAKRVKDMNVILRHTKKQPEIAEYYGDLLNVDVYEMMKQDFELFQPIFKERRVDDSWERTEPDWEAVNLAFKSAK